MPKTLVFINGLAGQDPALARAIEARLIERAPALTTGQLRAALNRDLLAADPEAAERRRQTEEKQARVERCPEQGGVTASLSGRNLPVPATVAAWNHVTAVARGLRRSGASGTLDELRVLVYLGLLSGQAASDLAAVPVGTEGGATPGETDVDDGSGPGPSHYFRRTERVGPARRERVGVARRLARRERVGAARREQERPIPRVTVQEQRIAEVRPEPSRKPEPSRQPERGSRRRRAAATSSVR